MKDNRSANRCVTIDCDIDDALTFVGKAGNLPAWTFFFRKAINRQGDRIRFDTQLGECLTQVRTKKGTGWAVARICSRFDRVEDSALLYFARDHGGHTLARFYATFPEELTHERRYAVLDEMHRELIRLKEILERMHAEKSLCTAT